MSSCPGRQGTEAGSPGLEIRAQKPRSSASWLGAREAGVVQAFWGVRGPDTYPRHTHTSSTLPDFPPELTQPVALTAPEVTSGSLAGPILIPILNSSPKLGVDARRGARGHVAAGQGHWRARLGFDLWFPSPLCCVTWGKPPAFSEPRFPRPEELAPTLGRAATRGA